MRSCHPLTRRGQLGLGLLKRGDQTFVRARTHVLPPTGFDMRYGALRQIAFGGDGGLRFPKAAKFGYDGSCVHKRR